MLCVVCSAPCFAADPLTGLLACRELTDSAARLACFDRETAALAPAASSTTALTPEQKFGLSSSAIVAKEEAAAAQPPKEAKLKARITALALAADGRTLFTLDNSQVWRQLEADGTDVMARLGDSVTVSRGILGSYWLQLKTGRGCKVKRLR